MFGPVRIINCVFVLSSLASSKSFGTYAPSGSIFSKTGCLPFLMNREIPDFTNALFETVSGFTTTGASILDNVEELSHASLFWRSFTHFIGGMGILVFVLAVMPRSEGSSIHIMRAEVPGPVVGKLVSKVTVTARILYGIYVGLRTVLCHHWSTES